MSQVALTVVGHDRPGIIARTTGILAELGMNLEDSSMTLLRGYFAMTLITAGPAGRAEVAAAMAPLVDDHLAVNVIDLPAHDPSAGSGGTVLVSVHGADRLGIVSAVAGAIAAAGGNITDLTTRLAGELYVLVAEVDLAPGTDAGALERAAVAAGEALGVDVRVRQVERDDL